MTPLQVILLGKRMREAQKANPDSLDAEELGRAFDDAIEPYVDYARNLEAEHERRD